MRHALPMMAARGGGAIVNWASLGGLIGVPAMSPYLASKGAVVQVTRGAALEYGRHGVRVNAVCPGHIETPMTERVGEAFGRASAAARESTARLMDDNAARGALGRNGTADEVAAVAAFLASDDASFLTGVALPVDGGRLAG
jgi:NAD(P)-dependent dehydrogenase (short-subunit alcohol dehydrogenase family)